MRLATQFGITEVAQIKYLLEKLPSMARDDAAHSGKSASARVQDLGQASLCDKAPERLKEAFVRGVIEQLVPVAKKHPASIESMSMSLSNFARNDKENHNKLLALIVEEGLGELLALAAISGRAAFYLAQAIVTSCTSSACLRKTIPAVFAAFQDIERDFPRGTSILINAMHHQIIDIRKNDAAALSTILMDKGVSTLKKMRTANGKWFVHNALRTLCVDHPTTHDTTKLPVLKHNYDGEPVATPTAMRRPIQKKHLVKDGKKHG